MRSEDWRPIESAPKDGTTVLLYFPDRGSVCGSWDKDEYARKPAPYWSRDTERIFGVRETRANQPTHWMPLPEPPAPEGS